MIKLVSKGRPALRKIKEGIDLVADPVTSTLGAAGRTVIISETFVHDYSTRHLPIVVTKDGWRVSQSINSSDPLTQAGVLFIQEAAQKQMNDAGDGTTTCCLLTQAIVEEGIKAIEGGAEPHQLKKSIDNAVIDIVNQLRDAAIPIGGDIEKIRQVATISANNDEYIGNLIADAYSKIGINGTVQIEDAKGVDTSIKIADGFKFVRGWASPYFITNFAKEECVLEDPYILIYDRAITILKDVIPIMSKVISEKRSLLVIAEDSDGDALAAFTMNAANKTLPCCIVNMKYAGDGKIKIMEDIAAITGGTFINELKGVELKNVSIQHLGRAKKAVISKENTVIVGGIKNEESYSKYVADLKSQKNEAEGQEDKDNIDKRIARLNEGVAILSIGATTEVEMKEKKDRADDAVRATKCAIEEGYVPGGGIAFLRLKPTNTILDNVMKAPIMQLCKNAGVTGVVEEVVAANGSIGFNAKTGKIENLEDAGIIEAVKSNRCAIQNAASVACQILTSQYIITDFQ